MGSKLNVILFYTLLHLGQVCFGQERYAENDVQSEEENGIVKKEADSIKLIKLFKFLEIDGYGEGTVKDAYQKYSRAPLNKKSSNEPFPFAVTKDGNTVYFDKIIYQKPLYGLFSKKEGFRKIYQANYSDGQWQNATEISVTSKYDSALHPTISEDGKRLFFASNISGTYGKFDIYVANIKDDGTLGIAMNLGPKVNTRQDELFPVIHKNNWLFFSSGRSSKNDHHFDRYFVEVTNRNVGKSVKLNQNEETAAENTIIHIAAKE